jgi:glycosyltransferase involved in cell wall biosynthesis
MPARRLLFFVNADWYFCSHRLPMARAAREAGFEVHVATHVQDHGAQILGDGFQLHPLRLRRGSTNPLNFLTSVREVRALYSALRPDLVHHVGVQPSVTGSLAAVGLPLKTLNAITGMGFVFTSQTPKARVVRAAVSPVMRHLFSRRGAAVLVQNPDDRDALVRIGVSSRAIAHIPGSGVDADRFAPLVEPELPLRVGYVGRLLRDKGLASLVEAHRLARERGKGFALSMAGVADLNNPASFSPGEVASWGEREGIEMLGHVMDIRDVWRACHVAVLPSRREGLPLSLLEAAACGRPLVATDVPGCREVVRHGVNGLLVPVDEPAALAAAIEKLGEDSDLRGCFGAAARQLVEERFSTTRIGEDVVRLYEGLLDGRADPETFGSN